MNYRNVALLLDSAHADVDEPRGSHIQARLQASGAVIRVISYARGVLHYYRELRKLVKAYSITVAHVMPRARSGCMRYCETSRR